MTSVYDSWRTALPSEAGEYAFGCNNYGCGERGAPIRVYGEDFAHASDRALDMRCLCCGGPIVELEQCRDDTDDDADAAFELEEKLHVIEDVLTSRSWPRSAAAYLRGKRDALQAQLDALDARLVPVEEKLCGPPRLLPERHAWRPLLGAKVATYYREQQNQAIALACSEGLTGRPRCVHEQDRRYGSILNDAPWSSETARAEGMRPLALLQVGTAGRSRATWVAKLAEGTIRRVVPEALEAAAQAVGSPHARRLREAAARCRREGTREAALSAGWDADDVAYAAARSAARSAGWAAADASRCASWPDGWAAADLARSAVWAAEAARAAGAGGVSGDPDRVLKIAVQVAVDAYEEDDQ